MKNEVKEKNTGYELWHTPLVKLERYISYYNYKNRLYAKLEWENPTGSIKDRVAYQMIKDAEDLGLLVKTSTIIEATSGNTGVGLAYFGSLRGYRVIIVMPENMSIIKINLIKKFGGEVVLTRKEEGMAGSISRAEELSKEISNSYIPKQFENQSNPKAHYLTTGKEIYEDLKDVDYIISGIGTGGTISGIGRFFKEINKNVKLIGVEPSLSPIITKGYKGIHRIEGIGAGFIPKTLDLSLIDEVIDISDEEAFNERKVLEETEGLLAGISSGAVLAAFKKISKRVENKNIVVIFPDGADRYE